MRVTDDRDPRVDPKPGDELEHEGRKACIHFVEKSIVYFARDWSLGGWQIPLELYREQAKYAKFVRAVEPEEDEVAE